MHLYIVPIISAVHSVSTLDGPSCTYNYVLVYIVICTIVIRILFRFEGGREGIARHSYSLPSWKIMFSVVNMVFQVLPLHRILPNGDLGLAI